MPAAVLLPPDAGPSARRAASRSRGLPSARRPSSRPAVRRALIARVRAELAAGRYVTEHKLDVAAARLLAGLVPA